MNKEEKAKANRREWYNNNKDKMKAYSDKWLSDPENRAKRTAYMKEYAEKNKEKRKESNKIYAQKNREMLTKKHYEYVQKNIEAVRTYQRIYHQKRRLRLKAEQAYSELMTMIDELSPALTPVEINTITSALTEYVDNNIHRNTVRQLMRGASTITDALTTDF